MTPHSFLQFIYAPAVALSCIVCPAAASTADFDARLNELTGSLAARYIASPQWPTLHSYLLNMRSSGKSNWTNRQKYSLLEYCLSELPGCDAALVHKLLLAGLDPNLPGAATGLTPLHYAAKAGDYRMALRLMAYGAKADARDKDGRSPADMTSHPQLRVLLRRGYPVELQSDEALVAWEKAREGDAAAMWELSRYYNDDTGIHSTYMSKWAREEQGGDADELEKLAWVEQAAAGGVAAAQYDLGLRLLFGRGVQADSAKAYSLIQAAGNQGLESAVEFLKENPNPES